MLVSRTQTPTVWGCLRARGQSRTRTCQTQARREAMQRESKFGVHVGQGPCLRTRQTDTVRPFLYNTRSTEGVYTNGRKTHARAIVVNCGCEKCMWRTRAGEMRGKLYTPPAHSALHVMATQTSHFFMPARTKMESLLLGERLGAIAERRP